MLALKLNPSVKNNAVLRAYGSLHGTMRAVVFEVPISAVAGDNNVSRLEFVIEDRISPGKTVAPAVVKKDETKVCNKCKLEYTTANCPQCGPPCIS